MTSTRFRIGAFASFGRGLMRKAEGAARRRVGRERPTVIAAGKSKLSDARSPLVISVTDEQAHKILEFTGRDA